MNLWQPSSRWTLVFGGLLLLAFDLGSLVGLGRIDYALTDQLRLLDGRKAGANIVIIGIDDKSIAELGRWPWRRDTHARLLEQLAPAGTRAIGLDIIFSEPDTVHPEDDRLLAQRVASAGNVVLPVVMQHVPGRAPLQSLPLEPLVAAARAVGHIHLELDTDGLARSIFLQEGVRGSQWDHFALAMYKAGGQDFPQAQLPGARAPNPGGREGDADAWQRDHWIQIPYTNPATGYKHYSYVDILKGRVPASELRGKYVLIGATTVGLGDSYPTPVSGHATLTPGVDISANVLDALERGDYLERATLWQNGIFSALPVILALLSLALLGARKGLIAVGCLVLLVPLATALAQRYAGLQLYPAAGLLCLLATYPLWSWRRLETVLAYLSAEAERFRVEHSGRPDNFKPMIADEMEQRMDNLHYAIEQSRKLQRLVSDSLDSLPDPTFIADRNGNITRANVNALRHLGGGKYASLVGEPLADVLAGFLTPESAARLPDLPQAPEPEITTLELTSQRGTDYLLKCVPRVAPSGMLTGWIVSLIDVHLVHEALRQRDEALRFISHDMRAPQSSILSLIELRRQGVDVGETDALLQRIETYSRRTLGIAEDFIQLAKAESGKCKLQLDDLQSVLSDAVDLVRAKAQARGIRIETAPGEALALAQVDYSLMSRAVMNLLDNAIKFSPDGTTVRCGVTDAGQHWQLWIRDQGPGIPPDELEFLFRKFWRSRGTRQSGVPGVGLGLAFVKLVVAAHSGEVGVCNLAAGGAQFQITLRKADPQTHDDDDEPTDASNAQLQTTVNSSVNKA